MENNLTCQLLIFRTNVKELCTNCALYKALEQHSAISRWTIDYEDIDCVLRIESGTLTAETLIALLDQHGFECAEME